MSKYAAVRAVMGGQEAYNDSAKNGRVLKWYSDRFGQSLQERKLQASQVLQKLIDAGVWYVQKVEVRNATGTAHRGTHSIVFEDDDKICVHIDRI